jgi:hypothetical protein
MTGAASGGPAGRSAGAGEVSNGCLSNRCTCGGWRQHLATLVVANFLGVGIS